MHRIMEIILSCDISALDADTFNERREKEIGR